MLTDPKLHFHQQVDKIFSHAITLMGLIQSDFLLFVTAQPLLSLHCTLVRLKLEYASAAWNSITFLDACRLERIQWKFCQYHFLSPRLQLIYSLKLLEITQCSQALPRCPFFLLMFSVVQNNVLPF